MKYNRSLLALALVPAVAMPVCGAPQGTLDLEMLPPLGQTVLWSPLFQASWDKMNASHAGKLERVVPPNPLMRRLDEFAWNEAAVMPAKGGYAVFAGPATAEFAQATGAGIREKFGIDMAPARLPERPGGIAVYGILIRDLAFQKEFFRARRVPLNFKDGNGKAHDVSFFGTAGELSDSYGHRVSVLGYAEGGKRFILSIATDRGDERLVVYRPLERESFKVAIEQVVAARRAPLDGPYGSVKDGHIHKNDTVKIPYVALRADTLFTDELAGARHYRGDAKPWTIGMAYQIIGFELFEKGARVRVETAVGEEPFGELPEPPKRVDYAPRRFVCDAPFFVFAWREKASLPYFAAWIDGGEVLVPFVREER